jgi:hypothetical protein
MKQNTTLFFSILVTLFGARVNAIDIPILKQIHVSHFMCPDLTGRYQPEPIEVDPERRIKILTSGLREDASPNIDAADIRIDSADPSLVMPVTLPNGVTKYRVNFSGLRYIEANHPDEFYRGGIFRVHQSRGFYADGTEMKGAYHNASWPWDAVIYTNARGEQIAFGGVMAQPGPGFLPNMTQNWTRSRWWGKVVHREIAPGKFEEQIWWQGPLHDFNRQPHKTWVGHGYGGTLLTRFNPATGLHEPVRLPNGNYLLFYERVVEEKATPDGRILPWVTTMFAREVDPLMHTTVGEEVLVTNIRSPVTNEYFQATRRGSAGAIEGYLAEGGNVLYDMQNQGYIKAWSANDYVGRYGIYLDYLPPGANPKSMYKPVTDASGELIDFAQTMNLRKIMDATWLGRPQLEYDRRGKLWLKFHFVPRSSIPVGAPHTGWPTAQQYLHYGRITAIAPVRIEYNWQGQPNLKLDIDPRFNR